MTAHEQHHDPAVARMIEAAKAEALRDMARKFRTEAAEVWGANVSWLTTGKKVADLVAFWCDDEADRIGGAS